MKLTHTMIRVKNLEKSLDFYTKIFDMKIAKKMRLSDCSLTFLADEDGNQIELTFNDVIPPEGYNIGNGFGHFAFSVNSFEDFTEKLKNAGYDYLYAPFKLENSNLTIAFVKDPDGYEVELVEE